MVKNIYAFEPIPKTFNYLLKHIKLNNSKKIIPNNFALSELKWRGGIFMA